MFSVGACARLVVLRRFVRVLGPGTCWVHCRSVAVLAECLCPALGAQAVRPHIGSGRSAGSVTDASDLLPRGPQQLQCMEEGGPS